jgi:3'-5' exoribonuclease
MRRFNAVVDAEAFIKRRAVEYLADGPELNTAMIALINRDFINGRGAREKHHAFAGGLCIHTAEVLDNAIEMGHPLGLDMAVLVQAAIWHDFGKIYDYEEPPFGGNARYTPHKKLIHHVQAGFADFRTIASDNGLDEAYIMDVCHCILSHHGRPEWGSVIVPQTPEAVILHTADSLSAWWGNDEKGRFLRD